MKKNCVLLLPQLMEEEICFFISHVFIELYWTWYKSITAAAKLHKYGAMLWRRCNHRGCDLLFERYRGWFIPAISVPRRGRSFARARAHVRQRELLNRFVQFPRGDRDSPSQSATSPQQRYHPRCRNTFTTVTYRGHIYMEPLRPPPSVNPIWSLPHIKLP